MVSLHARLELLCKVETQGLVGRGRTFCHRPVDMGESERRNESSAPTMQRASERERSVHTCCCHDRVSEVVLPVLVGLDVVPLELGCGKSKAVRQQACPKKGEKRATAGTDLLLLACLLGWVLRTCSVDIW